MESLYECEKVIVQGTRCLLTLDGSEHGINASCDTSHQLCHTTQSILARIRENITMWTVWAHAYTQDGCQYNSYLYKKGIRGSQWVFGHQKPSQVVSGYVASEGLRL